MDFCFVRNYINFCITKNCMISYLHIPSDNFIIVKCGKEFAIQTCQQNFLFLNKDICSSELVDFFSNEQCLKYFLYSSENIICTEDIIISRFHNLEYIFIRHLNILYSPHLLQDILSICKLLPVKWLLTSSFDLLTYEEILTSSLFE